MNVLAVKEMIKLGRKMKKLTVSKVLPCCCSWLLFINMLQLRKCIYAHTPLCYRHLYTCRLLLHTATGETRLKRSSILQRSILTRSSLCLSEFRKSVLHVCALLLNELSDPQATHTHTHSHTHTHTPVSYTHLTLPTNREV